MSLPYEDLYSGTIKGVYVNVVEITCGDTKIYLNDSGSAFSFNGHTYLAVGFSISEPDKASVEEGTGSLTIAGVPSEYVAIVQSAAFDTKFTLSAALVKLVLSGTTLLVEGGDYLLPPTEYDISSVSMKSSDGTMTLSLKTGGALGYIASKYRFTSTNFPGLCG